MSQRQCNCGLLLPDCVTLVTGTCGSHYPPPLPSLHSSHDTRVHHKAPFHSSLHTFIYFRHVSSAPFISRYSHFHHTFVSVITSLLHPSRPSSVFVLYVPMLHSSHDSHFHHAVLFFLASQAVKCLPFVKTTYHSVLLAWCYFHSIFGTKV